jgi:hypothetical protein
MNRRTLLGANLIRGANTIAVHYLPGMGLGNGARHRISWVTGIVRANVLFE